MAFKSIEAKRAWLRKWRAENPEKVREHRQRWNKKHPGEAAKQSLRSKNKHRKAINKRRRDRYAANKAAGVPYYLRNRALPKEHLAATDVADLRDLF